MTTTLTEFTHDIDNLIAFPRVGLQINSLVSDPATTAADIGNAICQDPRLAARVLRIANSPAYGLSTQVSTISRAISVVGTRYVRDLVLGLSTVTAFDNLSNELVGLEDFWDHSLYYAIAAGLLAAEAKVHHSETLFVAGLLHDIGQLIIFHKLPSKAKHALMLSIEEMDESALYLAERQVIGFDHAQVGAELLRHWQFPPLLVECVEWHHEPERASQFPREVAIVHIANAIATLAEINSVDASDVSPTGAETWSLLNLDSSIVEKTVRATQEQFQEMKSVLLSH